MEPKRPSYKKKKMEVLEDPLEKILLEQTKDAQNPDYAFGVYVCNELKQLDRKKTPWQNKNSAGAI